MELMDYFGYLASTGQLEGFESGEEDEDEDGTGTEEQPEE